MTNRGAGVSGLGDVRFGGAHVDVAAAALDEGVDERRETRRLDPSGAGQEHDGLGGAVIGRGRGRGRGLGRGGVLGRGRTTGGEHGLEVGYERGGEGVGPPGVVGHRSRRRDGRALGGRKEREGTGYGGRKGQKFQAKRRRKMECWNGVGALSLWIYPHRARFPCGARLFLTCTDLRGKSSTD
jgi:hypothetical protein